MEPSAWYRYDPANGQVKKTAMFQTSPADFSDVEVIRQTAISKDGTHVPMTILRRKGTKLDGKNPTLLTAYGGYGISHAAEFFGAPPVVAGSRRRVGDRQSARRG